MTFCFAKGGDCEDDRRLIAMRKAFFYLLGLMSQRHNTVQGVDSHDVAR